MKQVIASVLQEASDKCIFTVKPLPNLQEKKVHINTHKMAMWWVGGGAEGTVHCSHK